MAVIVFIDTTLPAACTPASVRAARARLTCILVPNVSPVYKGGLSITLSGSTALSADTAPAWTMALKRAPSIVRGTSG